MYNFLIEHILLIYSIIVPIILFCAPTKDDGRFKILRLFGALLIGFASIEIFKHPLDPQLNIHIPEYSFIQTVLLKIWTLVLISIYIGWWEILWRVVNRHKKHEKSYLFLSNSFIGISVLIPSAYFAFIVYSIFN